MKETRDYECYYCSFKSTKRDFSLFHMHSIHWPDIECKFKGLTLQMSQTSKQEKSPEHEQSKEQEKEDVEDLSEDDNLKSETILEQEMIVEENDSPDMLASQIKSEIVNPDEEDDDLFADIGSSIHEADESNTEARQFCLMETSDITTDNRTDIMANLGSTISVADDPDAKAKRLRLMGMSAARSAKRAEVRTNLVSAISEAEDHNAKARRLRLMEMSRIRTNTRNNARPNPRAAIFDADEPNAKERRLRLMERSAIRNTPSDPLQGCRDYVVPEENKETHTIPCQLCPRMFKSKQERFDHFEQFHGLIFIKKLGLVCRQCKRGHKISKFSLQVASLISHVKDKHSYTCTKCHISIATKWSLNLHKKHVHRIDTPLDCNFCFEKFPTKEVLANHETVEHPVPEATNVWQIPEQVVNREDGLKCSHCNYIADRLRTLTMHNIKEHGYVKCRRCVKIDPPGESHQCVQASFDRLKDTIPLKASNLRLFVCEECGQKAYSRDDIYGHIQDWHTKETNTEELTPLATLQCPVKSCKMKIQGGDKLVQHVQSDHGYVCCDRCSEVIRPEERSGHICVRSIAKSDFSLAYSCYLCQSRTYNKITNVRAHVKAEHAGVSVQCEECERIFDSDVKLKRHMNTTHSKKNLFKCPTCNLVVGRYSSLATHMKTHDVGAIRKCNFPDCNFEASSLWTVRVHKNEEHLTFTESKTYSGDFVCHYCPFKVCTEKFLKEHIKIIHKERAQL